MRREPVWRRYLRFWGASPEEDVNEEFQFHIETKTQELRQRGLGAEEARREALREFGPLQPTMAECVAISSTRERRASWMEYAAGWGDDLRYSVRILRKSKGASLAAGLILAVGIGATTAVFTVVDRMMYAPLPVGDPSTLTLVSHPEGVTFRYADYSYLRDHNQALAGLAAEATLTATERRGNQRIEQPARADLVTGNYFDVLGVAPLAGRTLTASDDVWSAAAHVAVAGHRFASRRYLAPKDAIGATVYLENVPYTVVGVMPPGFFGTQKGYDSDLYVPIGILGELFPSARVNEGCYLRAFGRLRPGFDRRRAQADLETLWKQSKSIRPKTDPDDGIECKEGVRGYVGMGDAQRRSLAVLSAIVGILLLIGCANVGCLMVARGAARQHETAIRLSLGARRTRILRQSFLESGLLAIGGGMGAIAIAQFGCRLLVMAFHWQKRPLDVSPDGRALLFALGVSAASAILFGIAPALQLLRGGSAPLTRGQSVPPFSPGKALVTVEVALSLMLVAGAALFVRSFQNLRAVPKGFVADHVAVLRLLPDTEDRALKPPLEAAQALAESLRHEPGIESVALTNFVIFNDGYVLYTARAVGSPQLLSMRQLAVSPEYWKTLDIRVLAGRTFTYRDDGSAPKVAVLNEAAAKRMFPDQNPLGRRILTGMATRNPKPGDETEVVGVVADTKFGSVAQPAPELVYRPLPQAPVNTRGVVLEARATGDASAIGSLARARVRQLRLPVTVNSVTALNDEIDVSLADDSVRMRASGIFGGLALALVAAGLYGLMGYMVARRTREIGIRAAVGADATRIIALVARQSLQLVALGIALGIPGAVLVIRALSKMVFGLPPLDYASLAIAVGLLAVTGLAASIAPAWRAAHIEPMKALRVQ